MHKKYSLSLFIFRRDLRIQDNTALNMALEQSEQVLPCFIFDPAQITDQNAYRSLPAVQFMIESLVDLQEQLAHNGGNLYIFEGDPAQVIRDVNTRFKRPTAIQAVFVNTDYTPFSRARDKQIESVCKATGIDFNSYHDLLLINPDTHLTKSHTPYLVFTPFYKATKDLSIPRPHALKHRNLFTDTNVLTTSLAKLDHLRFPTKLTRKAGRSGGLAQLQKINSFENYADIRDYPTYKTTELSAHNKFGTVSIREVYWSIADALGKYHELIRALYWRDFFTYIAYHHPHVFGHAYRSQFEHITWADNEQFFHAWCTGQTGFPLVDAGMRQLNQTGFMHNRVRMITASLLVKDLHINWLRGEQYFAQKLIDYDPAVNNGNWQWVASTGTDAQPYFRIFNPWLQQKKYDPECTYIKEWIPELRDLSPREIHAWYTQKRVLSNYPAPLVDHQKEVIHTKLAYKKAANKKHA